MACPRAHSWDTGQEKQTLLRTLQTSTHLVKGAQDHEAPITPFPEMPKDVPLLFKQDTGVAITTPLAPIFPEHRRQGRDWRQVAKLWMTDEPLVLERSTGREGRTWELPLLVPAHSPTLALAPHLGWRAESSPCQNWAASSLVSRS